jgi:intracellular sulfur oxidation DsrE/DsrF family protein
MNSKLAVTLLYLGGVGVTLAFALAQRPTPQPASPTAPIIADLGKVVPYPEATDQPQKGAKVVFDVTADAKADQVNKGLERPARLLNLYGLAGLKAEDVSIVVVLHGNATKCVLTDAAYRQRFQTPTNPNLPAIRSLQKAGVEVLVCGQSLANLGYPLTEVAPEAKLALSAMTAVINRQRAGYAYFPVP